MGAPPPLAPFLHHAWLGYWEHVPADEPRVVIHRRHVAHSLMYLASGPVQYRWVNRGVGRCYHMTPGTIRFDPANGETSTFLGQHNPAHRFYTLLIPQPHLHEIATSEEINVPAMSRHLFVPDDTELQWCMSRLSTCVGGVDENVARQEEAARRLILRLHRLCGGPEPEWEADASPFAGVILHNLRDYIDAHLRLAPSLGDMAMRVGLSPSHFAKKFRRSTGLSLQRFVNRRRILASIPLLQANSDTLAGIALDLGFSSQSHFTRLFSDLTGMTPAKFQKQVRRTVGWQAPGATPAPSQTPPTGSRTVPLLARQKDPHPPTRSPRRLA
jgi:AraC-like DNA-binding protein